MCKFFLFFAFFGLPIGVEAATCEGYKRIEDCQVILTCKEKSYNSVYVETEIWLKDNSMTLVKYLNNEGGKRTKMIDYVVEMFENGKSVQLKNMDDHYLEINKTNRKTTFNERVMNKNYKTDMSCQD